MCCPNMQRLSSMSTDSNLEYLSARIMETFACRSAMFTHSQTTELELTCRSGPNFVHCLKSTSKQRLSCWPSPKPQWSHNDKWPTASPPTLPAMWRALRGGLAVTACYTTKWYVTKNRTCPGLLLSFALFAQAFKSRCRELSLDRR